MNAALLCIDIQQGLDDPQYGVRNNPGAEQNVARLLAAWRGAGRPVVHVQHMSVTPGSPLRPGLPGNALKPEALPLPGEPLFQKSTSNAFAGTALESHLRGREIGRLVVVGLTTDHCVSSTARAAADLGFAVTVVADATATHPRHAPDGTLLTADQMHTAALASLEGEFAAVRTTDQILKESS